MKWIIFFLKVNRKVGNKRTSIGLNPKTKLIAGVPDVEHWGRPATCRTSLEKRPIPCLWVADWLLARQQMDSQPQTGLPPVTMSGPGPAPALAGPGCVPELDPGGVDLGTHMGVGGMDSGLESMWSPPPTPRLHQSQGLLSQPYYRVDFPVAFYLWEAVAETIGHQMIPQPSKHCQLWSFHSTHLPKFMGLLW